MRISPCAAMVFLAGLLAAALTQDVSAAGGGAGAKVVYPNPFTEGTVFQLSMPNDARIRISVYDLLGKPIRTLFEGIHPKGNYDVPWDGNDETGKPVIPGMYICVLFSENVAVKSVKVIKIAA